MQRFRALVEAIYRLYEHSGFSMAGAIAFSFVVALFPFCIFLGALSGLFGGREVAAEAIHQLFLLMPTKVAEALAPEVDAIMSTRRVDLLTVSGGLTLFFATSANETLRAALNLAYRVKETRTYPLCWFYSAVFVIIVSVATLTLTAVGLFGPMFAAQLGIEWLSNFLDQSWFALTMRYLFATIVIAALLFGAHLWIAGGQRSFRDVFPGVILSILLMLAAASVYSRYLNFNDYSRFYAGLSQLMVALIFFQAIAYSILLGAELNRGWMELRRVNGAPGLLASSGH